MDVASLQPVIRFLMPTSWIALAIVGFLAPREPHARGLAIQVVGFFTSAFITRLAIEHHLSRSQIACFVVGATFLEALHAKGKATRPSAAFWAVAVAASVIGAAAARPIAHNYPISTW